MTITVSPNVEAQAREKAAAEGILVEAYVAKLILEDLWMEFEKRFGGRRSQIRGHSLGRHGRGETGPRSVFLAPCPQRMERCTETLAAGALWPPAEWHFNYAEYFRMNRSIRSSPRVISCIDVAYEMRT